MKGIILASLLLITTFSFSKTVIAQTDSANLPITIKLPVKAIILYGAYLSTMNNWADRKMPEALLPAIGSGTQLDSVVTVTVISGKLATFITQLLGDRYGALTTVNRSIFNNSPAITGYTALTTQISTIASGNTSQKAAAIYVSNVYTTYNNNLSAIYDQMIATGLNWIKT